jgi:hypothetical protein
MKEFAHGIGQYKSWHGDLPRRAEFLGKVVRLTKRHTHKSFSAGISIPALNSMNDAFEWPDEAMKVPYAWCGFNALLRIYDWMKKNARDGQLEVVIESGDKDQWRFIDMCRRLLNFEPIPRNKAACSPFQICDFLAWEHSRLRRDRLTGKHATRRSLVELYRQIPNDGSWVYSNAEEVAALCSAKGYAK